MKKETVLRTVNIISLTLAFFNFMMYYSMRCCWSGISKTLGYEKAYDEFILNLPVILCVIIGIVLVVNIVLFFLPKKENDVSIFITGPINVIFTIAIFVIIALGAADYMYFIWPEFFTLCGILLIIAALVFFIFYYPNTPLKDSKVFKFSLLGVIAISTLVGLINFSINTITYKPVVYAVEDTYQIVFSSSSESLGWVEINGIKYHETYAGSQTSSSKVHKVTVPMTVLDEAKAYSIHSQKLIYRGPFGGIKDQEISESYTFKPVDTSDGLTYYALADVHMTYEGALKAASYCENMELLVLNGDLISMVDSFDDANYVNKVAYGITKGEIPVIHSRGNHEIKGKYAEDFHKFVGSKNGNFYFNVKIKDLYALVLDIGEDHDDDYWEYYGTANYDDYRNDQLRFIEEEIANKDFLDYKYRLVVCHIPLVFVNSRKNHVPFKDEVTALLNQMDIHMALSGHQHDLFVFEPGVVKPNEKLTYHENYGGKTYKGYLTDFNFPNLLISKRGFTQTDDVGLTSNKHIGLGITVDFKNNKQTAIYNTYYGDKVNIVNPFANINYGDEIEIDLTTKEFRKI